MTALLNIKSALDALANHAKATRTQQGILGDLATNDASSMVAAVNSLQTELNALAAAAGATIDNNVSAPDKTWSSSKIAAELSTATQNAIDTLTGGTLDAAKDQLVELVAFIEANESSITAMLQTQGNRVAFDVVQSKTTAQQATARSNIGAASAVELGDPSIDFLNSVQTILAS